MTFYKKKSSLPFSEHMVNLMLEVEVEVVWAWWDELYEQYSTELPNMPVKAILKTYLIKRAGFVE